MPNNKMLIDASHPEETRVVVLRGNRIEEFDFESANKMPLRGNIYLAKVTRVEPSLQAAFVEYGGNRHGFLAFSEIHPDYYQIPVADRQALLEDEARERRDEDEEEEARRTRPAQQNQQQQQRRSRRFRGKGGNDRNAQRASRNDETIAGDAPQPGHNGDFDTADNASHSGTGFQPGDVREAEQHNPDGTQYGSPAPESFAGGVQSAPAATPEDIQNQMAETVAPAPEAPAADPAPHYAEEARDANRDEPRSYAENGDVNALSPSVNHDEDDSDEGDEEEETVEQVGGDELEEMARPQRRTRRQYKIQEVIKRRQVLLIQVVKEERGNKGAALTTYLSLAGRYSVLMPNTARGGGISRKITDGDDRKRLREIAGALDVPEGMGVILRTAGAARGKEEVQRDFEYLLRMWESVRELTLRSMAPALVYEEGSLIKRSIRDLYGKDIDEVIVAGNAGYKEARDFMGMLMPTHVDNVQEWKEQQPVFAKFGVEQQLDSMFSNVVTLKSGGYIVVNQTEALVAIDVNSGRSTREHNIEDTALRTNLEAADEVARQLRLRDLAGLIVVDFIDMEEYRNNRSVERRMKDALKNDRARIQVGRISHFGLLEMSRQRMRTGVLEGSSVVCQHCLGAGTVRSTASIALHVLRLIEDSLIRSNQFNLTVRTRTEVALYILNQKRAHLRDLEERFGIVLTIAADDTLTGSNYHGIDRGEPATPSQMPAKARPQQIRVDSIAPVYEYDEPVAPAEAEDVAGDDADDEAETVNPASTDSEREDAQRRKRRRRRGGRNRESSGIEADAPQPSDDLLAVVADYAAPPQRQPFAPQQNGGVETEIAAAPSSGDGQDNESQPLRNGRRRRGGRGRDSEYRPRFAEGSPQPAGNWVQSRDAAPTGETKSGEESNAPASESVNSSPAPAGGSWAPASPSAAYLSEAQAPSPREAATAFSPPPIAEQPKPQFTSEQTEAVNAEPARATIDDEKAAAERRRIAALPEAPPPDQKRGGWWQRARDALGG